MTAVITATVVDSAACNDHYIGSVCNIEIVIHLIVHAGSIDNDRNADGFSFCLAININVDSLSVFFSLNLHMFTVSMTDGNSVLAKIVGAFLFELSSADLL